MLVSDGVKYAYDVIENKVIACKLVRKACQRFITDFDQAKERGFYFDEDSAQHALDFFHFLKHTKGSQFAGKPFILEDWQIFIVINLFGWYRDDGRLRFNYAYIEIARKNGKTTFMAGVMLYKTFLEGEPGAEGYVAATKRDQAKICFNECRAMVQASPELTKYLDNQKTQIVNTSTRSVLVPLGRDADTMDGLNVHIAGVDEFHAHKTPELYDVLDSATGSRVSPLMLMITTAGFNKEGICFQKRDYVTKILQDVIDDDHWFGIIYTLDDGDDFFDEQTWYKANPNLGRSASIEQHRKMSNQAKEDPRNLNNFLTKHLNVWTNSETAWLDLDYWDACFEDFKEEDLKGCHCYSGVDLSSKSDVTSHVKVYIKDDLYYVVADQYLPNDAIFKRVQKNQVPYDKWVHDGWLKVTPGNVIDYKFIKHDIKQSHARIPIYEIAIDPWNSVEFAGELQQEGFEMVSMRQGYKTMSPAMQDLEVLIKKGKIRHNGDPVLKWMFSNVTVSTDPAGNIKPDKQKSKEKIDGVVALIMAVARALNPERKKKSIYESEGFDIFI